tara:strand:+ start:602 stop:1528 length:927 start_codon:yes stop_codon:yes gene_type:complete
MAFKMKKPSMTQGTARYKAACEAIMVNRNMDASSLPDGRAKSSAFQKTDDYAEAKKKDPNLDKYIIERKNYKPGSEDYEKVQAKINSAYGKERNQKLKAAQVAKSDKEMGPSKSKAGEESLKSTMTKETDKGKNKTVTTTKKADEKGSSTEVVKEKKNKTKTTTTSKDDATGKETKISSKVKKDKEGNVRKEKDTVVADGKVSTRTTKYDKEGNVKKSKVKNRKQFSETKVGKFLSGKKNKDEKTSPATKYSKSMATKPEDLEVGNRKNLPDALKAKISAAPKYAKGMPKYKSDAQRKAVHASKADKK